jgi:hypothetical protein
VGCTLIKTYKFLKMKLTFYILLLSGFCLFSGCAKEEEINNTETQVGHSRVTFFPVLQLQGDRYVPVALGSTYTEPGATAKEGETDITPTISGTVNTNTPGVYTIIYTATNKDGFSVSERRTVVVYSTDASAADNDLSGNYARNTNGSVAVWTKIAPGVYTVFNPGGAPGTNLTVVAINPTGFSIDIPEQQASDGSVTSSAQESYTNGSPATYSWQILNPGYGTALRTFTKQ